MLAVIICVQIFIYTRPLDFVWLNSIYTESMEMNILKIPTWSKKGISDD